MADAARRIRLLKRLALLVFVASVLGVAGLYMLGREARLDEGGRHAPIPDDLSPEGSRQAGEGFDHTLMRGDEPLFRIRGSRDRQGDEGGIVVEEVEVTVFREDGDLRVVADEATYDLDAEEARLQGDVHVEGREGFQLDTDVLLIVAGGDAIQTDGPLEFRYGGDSPLAGKADWFRANLRRDVFILRGDVEIRNQEDALPHFLVQAPRVFLERHDNMLRALDGVRVEWDQSIVLAKKVTAHLGPRNREIHFLRAQSDVTGVIKPRPPKDGYRRLSIKGSRLGVLFDASTPSKIEVEDLEDGVCEVRAVRNTGEELELTAGYVEADLRDGDLEGAHAVGEVVLVQRLPPTEPSETVEETEGDEVGAGNESPPAPTLRRATAERADVTFGPEGALRVAELQGGIRIEEESRSLDGDSARILPESLEAHGEPALLVGPQGELRAPEVRYNYESKLAHATGGVQTLMADDPDSGATAPLRGTPLGETREPVRVVSQEAFFRDEPRSFLFKGAVRAWSGTDVILTEQLRGESDPQRLAAAEGVETQWTVVPEEGSEPRPIRINARTMIYEPEEQQLEYRDQVTVVEPGRRLSCRVLTADLTEEGELRHITCVERVVLESDAEGRRIEGDRAEYDLGDRRVRFFGEPLKMIDREGAEVECRALDYSLVTGTALCTGADEAGPTPEQEPS